MEIIQIKVNIKLDLLPYQKSNYILNEQMYFYKSLKAFPFKHFDNIFLLDYKCTK